MITLDEGKTFKNNFYRITKFGHQKLIITFQRMLILISKLKPFFSPAVPFAALPDFVLSGNTGKRGNFLFLK